MFLAHLDNHVPYYKPHNPQNRSMYDYEWTYGMRRQWLISTYCSGNHVKPRETSDRTSVLSKLQFLGNKDIQIPSKHNKIYFTLPLLDYMLRLLRVIIINYLIPSALWDPRVH